MKLHIFMSGIVFMLVLPVTQTAQQIPAYLPQDGLLAWYPFNGNANDESEHGQNATVNGPVLIEDRFGNPNSAYDFEGGQDRIIAPSLFSQGVSEMTILAWFRPEFSGVTTIHKSLWHNDGPPEIGVCYFTWYPNPSNVRVGYGAVDGNFTSINFDNPSQEWHCAIMTYDGAELKAYLDGELMGVSPLEPELYISPEPFAIGNLESNPIQTFIGQIDDVGVWDRALTEFEIAQLYTSEVIINCPPPDYLPTEGLVAYYPFCGNANDESGNGNDATPQGNISLTEDRFGNALSAYYLEGVNATFSDQGGHILLPSLDSMDWNEFSINLWVYEESVYSDGESFIEFGYSPQEITIRKSSGGGVPFQVHDGWGIGLPAEDAVFQGQWVNYCMTYSSTEGLKGYVDGQLFDSTDQYDGELNPPSEFAAIGRHWWNGGNSTSTRFTGKVDDVAIYSRPLSQEEVLHLYWQDTCNPCNVNWALGDLNCDGEVNVADLLTFLPNFGMTIE